MGASRSASWMGSLAPPGSPKTPRAPRSSAAISPSAPRIVRGVEGWDVGEYEHGCRRARGGRGRRARRQRLLGRRGARRKGEREAAGVSRRCVTSPELLCRRATHPLTSSVLEVLRCPHARHPTARVRPRRHLRYEEVDDPSPPPGRCSRVRASGVHLLHTTIRRGPSPFPHPTPRARLRGRRRRRCGRRRRRRVLARRAGGRDLARPAALRRARGPRALHRCPTGCAGGRCR